jgi:hypothetical protein
MDPTDPTATLHETNSVLFTDPDPQHCTKQIVPSLRIRICNTAYNKLCPLTELYEGGLAGGHLHDGAAQGPDVGRGAVPTLPFVNHLHKKRYKINKLYSDKTQLATPKHPEIT